MEAQLFFARHTAPVGMNQAAMDQRKRVLVGRRSRLVRHQLDDGAEPELTPDHGSPRDEGALARAEPVEAGREENLNRVRNLLLAGPPTAFLTGLQQLLHKERIAFCGLHDLTPLGSAQGVAAQAKVE
jgi:hypothetical protein